MARVLPLPREVQDCVAELARFEPTPSAMAMKRHLEDCPWVAPMLEHFPCLPPSYFILRADALGLVGCRKCNSCDFATLHQIRRQFDPDFMSDSETDDVIQ